METMDALLKLHTDDYEQAEHFLYALPKFTKKRALSDVKRMTEYLSFSGKEVPMIHVAGTNGKGSVCAYLQSFLMKRSLRVGMFTSPHLVRMTERFNVSSEDATDAEFMEAFFAIRKLAEEDYAKTGSFPTFFEFLFLMAIVYFRKKKVDVIIWETGLGGRLDATNVFEGPDISVITAIGLDHCKYLGDTVEKIAWEKAGIIKTDSFVVYDRTKQPAAEVIQTQIREKNARDCGLDAGETTILKISEKNIDFSYNSRYYNNAIFHVAHGVYQPENISLALRAAECFFDRNDLTQLSESEADEAIGATLWPGRMEEIAEDVFFDGAHNSHGVRAFLRSVEAMGKGSNSLCFSVVNDKDYDEMVGLLHDSGYFDRVLAVEMPEDRGLTETELQELFSRFPDWDVTYCSGIEEAVMWCKGQIRSQAVDTTEKRRVYVVGSLYLVGLFKGYIKEGHR